MDARNTFFWTAQQYASLNATFRTSGNFNDLTVTDYKIATLRHWLRGYTNEAVVSRALSLERAGSPDGNLNGQKTWFDYAGKANLGGGNWGTQGTNAQPLFTARILPDGSSQFTYTERNRWELPTRVVTTYSTNPGVGTRENNMVYASNGIDLITLRGPNNELLSSNAYNGFHQVVTQFDAVTNRTDNTYDSAHHLTSLSGPTGLVTTNYFYTTGTNVGWLQTTIDFEGTLANAYRTNSFTYDKGLVSTSTDVRGLTTSRTWDALLRPTTLITPSSTNTYQYARLDLTNAINGLVFTNGFAFDRLGRMTNAAAAFNPPTSPFQNRSLGYVNGLPSVYTNALLQTESYAYDLGGRLLTTTFPDTSSLTNRYDLLGQVTNTMDAAGVSVTNWYNNQGLVYTSANAFGQVFYRMYDNRDRLTNEVDARGVPASMSYDNLGRLLTRSYPDGGVEQFQYSARGLITYTNQLTNVTHYGYDAVGRKTAETNANNEITRWVYNGAGDLLSVTDGKNQTTQFGYDQYGRQTNQVDSTGTTILRFKYDALGRLTNRWSAAKGDTFYSYDQAGNLKTIDYPASPDVSFTYDGENRLFMMDDAVGHSMFNYTSFGALLNEQVSWPDSNKVSYTYWTNHLRASITVDQADSSTVSQTYLYDTANRLHSISSPAGAFTYSYQGAGPLVQKIAYPNGAYMTNSYDNVARLQFTKLKNSSNNDLNSHAYLNNVGNQRYRQTRLDGSYVDYLYDKIGQLKSATGHESGGTVRLLENLGYGYDAAGNLNYRTNNALVQTYTPDSRNQLTNITRASTLTVSGATSLAATNVTVNGLSAARYADNTFAKDGFTLTNGVNTFTVIAQDSYGRADTNVIAANLPTTVSLTYDLNGNLTSDGLRGFTYDDENRLIQIVVTNSYKTQFTYDGLGRRRIRDEYVWFNGAWAYTLYVHYLYDGNLVIEERLGGDNSPVHYTRGLDVSGSLSGAGGIGGLLARSQNVSASPQHHFYHADGNGNVTMLINVAQQVTAKYLYDPYGNVLGSSGFMADVNLYRFSSKEVHDNSGLIYFGVRFYDPALHRWLNRDPIEYLDSDAQDGTAAIVATRAVGFVNPLTLGNGQIPNPFGTTTPAVPTTTKTIPSNLYSFVSNDPLSRTDPQGLVDRWYAPGQVNNQSKSPVVVVDVDNQRLAIVPPGNKSPGWFIDWDFVRLPDGRWFKIGGGQELIIGPDGQVKLVFTFFGNGSPAGKDMSTWLEKLYQDYLKKNQKE